MNVGEARDLVDFTTSAVEIVGRRLLERAAWIAFAAGCYAEPTATAEACGRAADAMLAEYHKRWPGGG